MKIKSRYNYFIFLSFCLLTFSNWSFSQNPIINQTGVLKVLEGFYMLSESRTRIASLIKEGKSIDEVIGADPTKGLFKGGESWLPAKLWVYTVCEDLSKK